MDLSPHLCFLRSGNFVLNLVLFGWWFYFDFFGD